VPRPVLKLGVSAELLSRRKSSDPQDEIARDEAPWMQEDVPLRIFLEREIAV